MKQNPKKNFHWGSIVRLEDKIQGYKVDEIIHNYTFCPSLHAFSAVLQ